MTSAFEQQTLADLPPLTAEDKARFTKIFYVNNPKNGVLTGMCSVHQGSPAPHVSTLSGAQARQLMLKSNLPPETLLRIWCVCSLSIVRVVSNRLNAGTSPMFRAGGPSTSGTLSLPCTSFEGA